MCHNYYLVRGTPTRSPTLNKTSGHASTPVYIQNGRPIHRVVYKFHSFGTEFRFLDLTLLQRNLNVDYLKYCNGTCTTLPMLHHTGGYKFWKSAEMRQSSRYVRKESKTWAVNAASGRRCNNDRLKNLIITRAGSSPKKYGSSLSSTLVKSPSNRTFGYS